jgi:hypothetical protein
MAEPKQINVIAQGLAKLLYQWRNSPNLTSFLTALLYQLHYVQQTYYQLLNERGLYTAAGAQLDIIGSIVGEERKGRTDSKYREAILTKISANRGSGTPSDVRAALRLLTNATNIKLFEHFPAATYIYANAYTSKATQAVVQTAHAAGVRTRLMWTEDEANTVFPGVETDSGVSYLIDNDDENIIVDTSGGSFYLQVESAVTTFGADHFTSLVPGATSYEVVDNKGKLVSLAPIYEVEAQTGYIIDNNNNYIIDNFGNYIRYVILSSGGSDDQPIYMIGAMQLN